MTQDEIIKVADAVAEKTYQQQGQFLALAIVAGVLLALLFSHFIGNLKDKKETGLHDQYYEKWKR